MKTFYVSDLDGTLLRSDETTSEYTNHVINDLVSKGMLFSYATARSYSTASKVTHGLDAKIPLIVYNGAMVVDNETGKIMLSNFFGKDITALLDDLIQNDIYPIVYSFIDGIEKFSYLYSQSSKGMQEFLATRKGDRRDNPIESIQDLYRGDIFYVTCIDEERKLEPLYKRYKEQYHCVYQSDIYSGEQWLEFMPLSASKANAIRQVKSLLEYDRLVVFGDGKNDIDMFQIADECYAVENAVEELKKLATAVLDSNNNDGVAKWLVQNFANP